MLLRSDPRITSALTNDASALALLSQMHGEITRTSDPNVLATTLGQYTAIASALLARRGAATPLPSAVTTSLQLQMAMDRRSRIMSTISNILKKVHEEAQTITNNLK